MLLTLKKTLPQKTLDKQNPFSLPSQLWKRFLQLSHIPDATSLHHIPHLALERLANKVTEDSYLIEGKTLYKQEFVTCGGVSLKEIDCTKMQSRLMQNLFFVGEVLDIDGVTGGFNFQNAWTTAFLAADAIQKSLV